MCVCVLFLCDSRAVSSVPAISKNFWQQVAATVGKGHSWSDCKDKHNEHIEPPKKRQFQTFSCVTEDPITAKRGTLKRRRQVQGALRVMDVGYSDDVFETAPLKKKMKRIKVSYCCRHNVLCI